MRVYFYERCAGATKSKNVWPTTKPVVSKQDSDLGNEMVVCEDETIIVSDQTEVCRILNIYFVNVAKIYRIDMSYVCHAFVSVHFCLVVTCWERADLLALNCNV